MLARHCRTSSFRLLRWARHNSGTSTKPNGTLPSINATSSPNEPTSSESSATVTKGRQSRSSIHRTPIVPADLKEFEAGLAAFERDVLQEEDTDAWKEEEIEVADSLSPFEDPVVLAKEEDINSFEKIPDIINAEQEPQQTSISLQEWQELEPAFAASVIHGRGSKRAYQHPRTHSIPVALIHFRSHFPHLLDLATHFATHAASSLAVPCSRPAYLPTKRTLWTVLRGPFAHKKSQENFERKVHKRAIKAWDADQEVVDRWITYLQLHPIAGVGMRIVRWYRVPVGFGKDHEISESVRLENVTDKQKMEDLAKQIIAQEMAVAKSATSSHAHAEHVHSR